MGNALITRVVVDTSVYIAVLRDVVFAQAFRPRYERELSRTYMSSVVVGELLAGAGMAGERRHAVELYAPFERVRRIVTPTHQTWKDAGELAAALARRQPDLRTKLRMGLQNDILIALGARAIGARVVTRNRRDFEIIRAFRPFQLEIV
jgi:predicted nucleic acid-binding protein